MPGQPAVLGQAARKPVFRADSVSGDRTPIATDGAAVAGRPTSTQPVLERRVLPVCRAYLELPAPLPDVPPPEVPPMPLLPDEPLPEVLLPDLLPLMPLLPIGAPVVAPCVAEEVPPDADAGPPVLLLPELGPWLDDVAPGDVARLSDAPLPDIAPEPDRLAEAPEAAPLMLLPLDMLPDDCCALAAPASAINAALQLATKMVLLMTLAPWRGRHRTATCCATGVQRQRACPRGRRVAAARLAPAGCGHGGAGACPAAVAWRDAPSTPSVRNL